MSYKKIFTVIAALILSVSAFAQNNTIAVPVPKTVNLGEGNDWIPLFFQGMITSNFQQFSGFNVVDRQNADMVKAEQKLSENAEFDEKNTIELGKMTNARLIITGSITGKNSSYALMFSITDTETGETKASTTIPNCLYSALENGDAANQISYELMKGYGINLSSTAQSVLTKKASVMTAETTAQVSVAKGIVAEKSGANIEALTYYIQAKKNDKKLNEATSRMASMTNVVTGGNFGANAKNLIKMRNEWNKLLREAAELIASNPPEFTLCYYENIKANEMTEADYDRGTMSFTVDSPYLKQTGGDENYKIAEELYRGLDKIPESNNWGDKINGFPWTYADDIPGNHWLKLAKGYNSEQFVFTLKLLDAKKNVIGQKDISFTVNYSHKFRYYSEDIESDNLGKYNKQLDSFTFNQIKIDDADTDTLYLTVIKKSGKDVSILPVPKPAVAEPVKEPPSYMLEAAQKGEGIPAKKAVRFIDSITKDYGFYTVNITGQVYAKDYKEITAAVEKNKYIKDINWKYINDMEFPEGVNTIGQANNQCMRFSENLKSVILPKSIKIIADATFSSCSKDLVVCYRGSKKDWKKLMKIGIGDENEPLLRATIIFDYEFTSFPR